MRRRWWVVPVKLDINIDFKVSRYYVLECYFMDRIRLRVVS